MEFIYTLDPTAEAPVLVIATHIGFDPQMGMGVNGVQFMKEIMELDKRGVKNMEVWINSPGGSVMEGYDIYNAMIKCKANVDTYCYGMAASMAAIIFQAGRKRKMADIATFMVHNPYGSSDESMLNAMRDGLISAVSSRSSNNKDAVSGMFDKESWFTATQCKNAGFCDEVVDTGSTYKPKAVTKENAFNVIQEYQSVFNTILKTDNNPIIMDVSKIKNALNLSNESSPEAVVEKIESLKKEVADGKAALEEKKKELDTLNATLEDEKKERVAVEVVENAIKEGRIKEDVKAEFVTLAKLNPEGVKATFAKMPSVKVAAVVAITPDTTKVVNGIPAERQSWTIRDWEKNDENGLANIKNSNPELYQSMYNAFYKKA